MLAWNKPPSLTPFMDPNVKQLHKDVLDIIELITKIKTDFDWKTLKKSMDAVEQAITIYEVVGHRANNELYDIQSALKYSLLKQLRIIKPANSLSSVIWQPGSCFWTLAQCNLSKTNQESKVHIQILWYFNQMFSWCDVWWPQTDGRGFEIGMTVWHSSKSVWPATSVHWAVDMAGTNLLASSKTSRLVGGI